MGMAGFEVSGWGPVSVHFNCGFFVCGDFDFQSAERSLALAAKLQVDTHNYQVPGDGAADCGRE
jgi:hypothetical protein